MKFVGKQMVALDTRKLGGGMMRLLNGLRKRCISSSSLSFNVRFSMLAQVGRLPRTAFGSQLT